ncbi:MAG: hypothetical protein ACI8QC_002566 [Planctomycetota bacterium]|jgi:hypothetical protein
MLKFTFAVLAAAVLAPTASAQVGAPFCFGDICPCGNTDVDAGCGNLGADGDLATGALLLGSGSADSLLDDLSLRVEGLPAEQFGVMIMGETQSAALNVGDGLLCIATGGSGLFRFPPRVSDSAGVLTEGGILAGADEIGAQVAVGSTWIFQGWYRDPGGPCGTSSNLSNALPVTFLPPGSTQPVEVELAGRPVAGYPFFERTLASNQGADLWVNVDPGRFPHLAGQNVDVYVVASREAAEWDIDDSLIDVRGAAQPFVLGAGGVDTGSLLVDAGLLNGTLGVQLGVSYDLVVDVDQDGLLGAGDLIDGLGDVPGVVVVRDPTLPGPHTVSTANYNLGFFQTQRVFYPTDVANLERLVPIIISHGNGHSYTWYDHIGEHLASYGYVVMSHTNETGPGIDTASDTTLINTDSFFGNLDVIAGGALLGHVDFEHVVWFGHSRGGEGIARAYVKLQDQVYVPQNYTRNDVVLLSSIAPTSFLGFNKSNPRDVDYHVWVGSADDDVTGQPGPTGIQTLVLFERATGSKTATILHGVGHGAFHAGGGSTVADGPCQVGRPATHTIMRGYLMPMLAWRMRGEHAGLDFSWRQWESFTPITVPTNTCVVVNLEYRAAAESRLIIDDFQEQPDIAVSSSGGSVSTDLLAMAEGRMQDLTNNLNWTAGDPFNGMARANGVFDQPHCITLSWQDPRFLTWNLPGENWDVRDYAFLSFRAAPIARHPDTIAVLEDLRFDVTLEDHWGRTSTLPIGHFGGGVEEPYQRGGGWSNEYEIQRLRLTDFTAEGRQLDLSRLVSVRLNFASPGASPEGAIGLDDLEFTRE